MAVDAGIQPLAVDAGVQPLALDAGVQLLVDVQFFAVDAALTKLNSAVFPPVHSEPQLGPPSFPIPLHDS